MPWGWEPAPQNPPSPASPAASLPDPSPRRTWRTTRELRRLRGNHICGRSWRRGGRGAGGGQGGLQPPKRGWGRRAAPAPNTRPEIPPNRLHQHPDVGRNRYSRAGRDRTRLPVQLPSPSRDGPQIPEKALSSPTLPNPLRKEKSLTGHVRAAGGTRLKAAPNVSNLLPVPGVRPDKVPPFGEEPLNLLLSAPLLLSSTSGLCSSPSPVAGTTVTQLPPATDG